jgi:hypothetical protein
VVREDRGLVSKNGWLINIALLVSRVKIERGKLISPLGTEYIGFRVSVGGIAPNPADQVRNYDDIEAILNQNKVEYKVHETKTTTGTFKSYTVET